MPTPGGVLPTGAVTQPPQLTTTTTTSTTITTTTTDTVNTTTTTVDEPATAPPICADALIAAIRNKDRSAFDQALKKTRLVADEISKNLGNPKRMGEFFALELNEIGVADTFWGKRSMTPLIAAASIDGNDGFHFLTLLLAAGADPRICTEDSGSALMHPTSTACIDLLLANRAPIDTENRHFGTALIRAAFDQLSEHAFQRLLNGGANANQMAFSAQFATEFERIVPYRETGPAMWTAMSERKTAEYRFSPLMAAACTGNLRHIELLIAAGADLDLAPGDRPRGFTPLMLAVAAGKPEAVKALLAAKADVEAVARDGSTALYLASSKGNCEMMQILIDAGAKVDRMDAEGMTTLMHVVYENGILVNHLMPDQIKEVVSLLTKNGAQPNRKMEARVDLAGRRDLHDPGYGENDPTAFKRYAVQREMEKYFG